MIIQIVRDNSDSAFAFIFAGILMLAFGGICTFFPSIVRKFDTRLTKVLENEDEYLFAVRLFGIVFLIFGVGLFVGAAFVIFYGGS